MKKDFTREDVSDQQMMKKFIDPGSVMMFKYDDSVLAEDDRNLVQDSCWFLGKEEPDHVMRVMELYKDKLELNRNIGPREPKLFVGEVVRHLIHVKSENVNLRTYDEIKVFRCPCCPLGQQLVHENLYAAETTWNSDGEPVDIRILNSDAERMASCNQLKSDCALSFLYQFPVFHCPTEFEYLVSPEEKPFTFAGMLSHVICKSQPFIQDIKRKFLQHIPESTADSKEERVFSCFQKVEDNFEDDPLEHSLEDPNDPEDTVEDQSFIDKQLLILQKSPLTDFFDPFFGIPVDQLDSHPNSPCHLTPNDHTFVPVSSSQNNSPPQYVSRSPPQYVSRSPPQYVSRSPPQHLSNSPPQHFSRSPPCCMPQSSPPKSNHFPSQRFINGWFSRPRSQSFSNDDDSDSEEESDDDSGEDSN